MNWVPNNFDYWPQFLCPDEASRLLSRLWKHLHWQQQEITLYGRRVLQPRLVAWYGDPGAYYGYSGIRLQPRAWTKDLQQVREQVEQQCGHRFNSVLANAYRDGSDSMGWHSDDEKELGAAPVIASLSLGAERTFRVRRRDRKTSGVTSSWGLELGHGSLLLMGAGFQTDFQHALPRSRRPFGLRINLTFRWVAAQEA